MSDEYVFPQDDPAKPNQHTRAGGLTKRELSAMMNTAAGMTPTAAVFFADKLLAELATSPLLAELERHDPDNISASPPTESRD